MKISIIVPVYNAEKYLAQCLESLVQQTIDIYEVIVVNNNSQDASQSIIDKYSESYPDVIKPTNEAQAGVSHARNKGLSIATGNYIGFVDADDYVEIEMFQKLYDSAMENSSEIAIGCRNNVFESNLKKSKIYPENFFNSLNYKEGNGFLRKVSLFVWDKIFSRKMIEENGIQFDDNLRYAEDYVFLMKCFIGSSKVSVVNEPLYNYRVSSQDSVSNKISESILDTPIALRVIIDLLIRDGSFTRNKEDIYKVVLGYYGRRLKAFSNQNGKATQVKYSQKMRSLMDEHFADVKSAPLILNKNEALAKKLDTKIKNDIYILSPNLVKSSLIKLNRLRRKSFIKKNLYFFSRSWMPLSENRALYASYSGASLSGSPYYLMQDAILNNSNVKASFLSNNIRRDSSFLIKNDIKGVELLSTRSIKYLYRLATCKYLITNSRFPTFFVKRENQILLNTWHGTPLKTLGLDIKQGAVDLWRNQTQFLMSNYFLTPNPYAKSSLLGAYGLDKLYNGEVLESDYPQNQIATFESKKVEIKKLLNIENKRVIAYMPTWRGLSAGSLNVIEQTNMYYQLFDYLENNLQSDCVVYYNLHQLVASKIKLYNSSKIKPFPSGFENYEFLCCTDILITDYSSIMFDYAATGKPVFLYIPDKEEYLSERGLYFPIEELPFTKSEDLASLLSEIEKSREISPVEIDLDNFNIAPYRESNIAPARYINSKFFGEIQDRTDTKEPSLLEHINKVVFLSDHMSKEERDFIVFNRNNKNIVYILDANTFSDDINSYLNDNNATLIVIPSDTLFSLLNMIEIRLWRMTGYFKLFARRAYKKELARILPNLKFTEIECFSRRTKYNEIKSIFSPE